MFTLNKRPEISGILKENSVDKIKFYYSDRDPFVNNNYTVCLFVDVSGKVLSRGVSICSVKDMHNKSTARNISFGRALKALISKNNSEPINPYRFSEKIFKNMVGTAPAIEKVIIKKNGVRIPLDYPLKEAVKFFSYKSEFNPTLTKKELNIISPKKKNAETGVISK